MAKKTKTSKVASRMGKVAKTNSKRVHITSREKGWAIKKEGKKKATVVIPTQKEAITRAKKMVQSGKASKVVIHKRSGKIRK